MEITDARVRLINDGSDRLKAFCSITFDDEFVIRDLKIVDGATGLFVAMPSRKNTNSCPDCRHKNVVRSRYCNDCGAELPPDQPQPMENGRNKSHRDIAHPITTEFREYVQKTVIAAYKQECKLASAPDYEPQELEEEPIENEDEELVEVPTVRGQREPRAPRGGRTERRQENVDYVNDYGALIANLKGGAPKEQRPAVEARRPAPQRSNQQDNRPPQKPRPPQRSEQRGEQRVEPRGEQRGRSSGPPREGHRDQPRRDGRDNREARPVHDQPQQRPPRTGSPPGERPAYKPAPPPSLEERVAMSTPTRAVEEEFGASIQTVKQEAPPARIPAPVRTPEPARAPEPVRAPAPVVRAPQPAPVVEPVADSEDSPFGMGV